MSKGREYVIKLLQNECKDDSAGFNNQKNIYFETMCNSQQKLMSIVQEADSKTVGVCTQKIQNLDQQINAVNDVLFDVKKILEYDID